MLGILIQKELRAIIHSPKFAGTFIVCSVLILLSVFTGIREYKSMAQRYDAASQMTDQELRSKTSWGKMNTRVYREPDPMQIFAAGLDYDIGRWSPISNRSTAKLKNSAYSDDPIYAVFRFIDFSFITRFILTLFAILLTYNAVNGEREDGTLRLVFSNVVSRSKYLFGKCIGAWLGLVVPISIPILLALLLLMVYNIPMTTSHWIKISALLILSLGLFTSFVTLGVFISSITRRSSVSFLLGLVIWVLFVMITPRMGIMAAGHMVYVPRTAEVEEQLNGFVQSKWDEFEKGLDERWAEYEQEQGGRIKMDDELLWRIMEKEDSLHREIENEITAYDLKLRSDLRQRKIYQQDLAFTLSRISPVSAYMLGVMSLAGTDVNVKTRYEDAINNYRNEFYEYVNAKQDESGDKGRIMMAISINEDGSQEMSTSGNRGSDNLDISGLPRFETPPFTMAEAISPAIIDFGIIALFIILSFAGAFVAFLKYDVR